MLLNLDSWVYSKLNAIPAIAGNVHFYYPNTFVSMPAVAYSTAQTNSDMDFQDDMAQYSDCRIEIDIYVANNVDDYSIADAIDAVMAGNFWTLDLSIPVPDPDDKLQHRHMEYSRRGVSAADLV